MHMGARPAGGLRAALPRPALRQVHGALRAGLHRQEGARGALSHRWGDRSPGRHSQGLLPGQALPCASGSPWPWRGRAGCLTRASPHTLSTSGEGRCSPAVEEGAREDGLAPGGLASAPSCLWVKNPELEVSTPGLHSRSGWRGQRWLGEGASWASGPGGGPRVNPLHILGK